MSYRIKNENTSFERKHHYSTVTVMKGEEG